MRDQKQTDKVKKQIKKLSIVMQKVEQLAKEEIKTREEIKSIMKRAVLKFF